MDVMDQNANLRRDAMGARQEACLPQAAKPTADSEC
jgi:hypothetical protein